MEDLSVKDRQRQALGKVKNGAEEDAPAGVLFFYLTEKQTRFV